MFPQCERLNYTREKAARPRSLEDLATCSRPEKKNTPLTGDIFRETKLIESASELDILQIMFFARILMNIGFLSITRLDLAMENIPHTYSPDRFAHTCLLLSPDREGVEWGGGGGRICLSPPRGIIELI